MGRRRRRGLRPLQDGLDLEVHLDLVAYDHPAAVEGHRDVDAEVLAVDLGLGREAGSGCRPRGRRDAVELEVEGDGAGHPVQRELALDDEVVAVGADGMER